MKSKENFIESEIEIFRKKRDEKKKKQLEEIESESKKIIKGYIKRNKRIYKIFFSLGLFLIVFSLFMIVTNFNFESEVFVLNNSVWNHIFYLGLSLFSISLPYDQQNPRP